MSKYFQILLHIIWTRASTAAMEELRVPGELQHGHGLGLHVREEVLRRDE